MADEIANHPVVSRSEWLSARTAYLAKEKQFTRLRDRDEDGFDSPQDWVRHHDRYGEG